MPTRFNLERPNSVWLHMWGNGVLRGSVTPPIPRGRNTHLRHSVHLPAGGVMMMMMMTAIECGARQVNGRTTGAAGRVITCTPTATSTSASGRTTCVTDRASTCTPAPACSTRVSGATASGPETARSLASEVSRLRRYTAAVCYCHFPPTFGSSLVFANRCLV